MAKSKYDWEAIEKDYRTGRFTNVQIGKMYGPTEGTIRNRATKHGWSKDLSNEINYGIRAGMQSDGSKDLTDQEIIDLAVQSGVELIREHRGDIRDLREIVKKVTKILCEQIDAGKLMIITKDGDPIQIDIPLEYLAKVLNPVTQSLERLIKLERQSFGMDKEEEQAGKSLEDLITELNEETQ